MQCTKCGTQNEDTARFCNSCGAALGVASPPPARGASTATVVALVAAGLLVVLIVGVVTFMLVANADKARMVAQIEAMEQLGKQQPAPSPQTQPGPGPQTVPATDPVAEAQVVLEKYLAADLGHDGNEMKKHLGGQAAARFEPSVQGQEDIQVSSQQVAGHEQIDDTAIAFEVEVEWSAEGASGVQTQTDRYMLRRTEEGWKVTSTPAYPE